MSFRFQHNRDVRCAVHSDSTSFDAEKVFEIPIDINKVILRRLGGEDWKNITDTIRRDDPGDREIGIAHNFFTLSGCVRASLAWKNAVEDYCKRHHINLNSSERRSLSYPEDVTSEVPQHTGSVPASGFSSEPLSITLNLSADNTNELLQQISGHLGNEAMLMDDPESSAVRTAPLVVMLGDGITRIARSTQADTFADVIAILGLKRISEIRPKLVSSLPPRPNDPNKSSWKKRGKYYVFTWGSRQTKKRRLDKLAADLAVDLIVEIND